MFKASISFALFATLCLPLTAQANFTYEGALTDSSNQPVRSSNVLLKLEVLSPGNCLLYGETQTVDTTNTEGYFSVEVGTGTSTGVSPYNIRQIFQSGKTFGSLTGCSSGASYTSALTDGRKLRVTVTVNSGAPELLGTLAINPVPLATAAATSRTLDEYESKHFLRVDPVAMTGGVPAFTSAEFSELMNLINGNFPPNPGSNGGTVTSVTAGIGLTGGTITTAGTLAVNVGTGPGQIPQLDGSGYIPPTTLPPNVLQSSFVLSGDLIGPITSPSVNKIKGLAISPTMPSAGNVFRFTGTEWAPAQMKLSEIYNSMGSSIFPGTCMPGETLSWAVPTDSFICSMVQITSGNIVDGSISINDLQSSVTDGLWSSSSQNAFRLTGLVGIGTNSPQAQLHVTNGGNTANATNLVLESFQSNTSKFPVLILKAAQGSQGSPGNTNAGQSVGGIAAMGYENGTPATGADILFHASANWAPSSHPTRIRFRTDDGGNMAERMVIDPTGNVGIATTAPAHKLHVEGDIYAGGFFRSTNGTIQTSDSRFKTNVEPIEKALEKILQLRGVTYDWKRQEFPERGFSERHQMGVIAQDVEAAFPEAVSTDDKGYKAVNYSALVAPLINAVKELDGLLQQKDLKIQHLQEENNQIKARLDRLEKMLEKQ